jgi:hypothetical protein
MKRTRKPSSDPKQTRFVGLIWRLLQPPATRLRAGDVIRIGKKICRVIRVNDCAAVVIMNRPPRVFTTRFDKPVSFAQPPAMFRIGSNSEVEILNRKSHRLTERRSA